MQPQRSPHYGPGRVSVVEHPVLAEVDLLAAQLAEVRRQLLAKIASAGVALPVAIVNGGTGEVTSAAAFAALAPTSGGDRGIIASDGAGGWVFVSTQSWPDGAVVVIDSGEAGGLAYSESAGGGASMAAVLARGLGA